MPTERCTAHSGIEEGIKSICGSLDRLREEIKEDRRDLKTNDLHHINSRIESLEKQSAAQAERDRATSEALQRIEEQMSKFAGRPPEPPAVTGQDGLTRKEFMQWIAVAVAAGVSLVLGIFNLIHKGR